MGRFNKNILRQGYIKTNYAFFCKTLFLKKKYAVTIFLLNGQINFYILGGIYKKVTAVMNRKYTIKLKIELCIQPLFCSICGLPILPNQQISLDHYIPLHYGGSDTAANLLPAHKICNTIKSDLMPVEFEKSKRELYQNALDNWKIKRKDRYIIQQALQNMK